MAKATLKPWTLFMRSRRNTGLNSHPAGNPLVHFSEEKQGDELPEPSSTALTERDENFSPFLHGQCRPELLVCILSTDARREARPNTALGPHFAIVMP